MISKKTRPERITIRVTKEEKKQLAKEAVRDGFFKKTQSGAKIANLAHYIRTCIGL